MKVLESGQITQGKKVAELEENFARYCGAKYAVATNSGTAALHCSLYAIGIKPGDEVITTPFTFVASANPIIMMGARPVFADINPNTFNIDPEEIKKKITPKTKAILPVDLYGQCADYKAIKEIAEDHNLKVVEDACQAVGAEYHSKKTGVLGDIAGFSFYATKNLMCGEGGIVTTDNQEYAELVKRFRHHGQSEQTRYQYYDLGYNYRLTDLAAVIALVNLKRIDSINAKRIENADFFDKILKSKKGIITPMRIKNAKHVFHQYTIKVAEESTISRDVLLEKLKNSGIGANIYYPKPLHLHPFFLRLGYKEGDFKASEKISQQVLSLPVHQHLSEEDRNIIKNFFEGL